MRGRRRGRCDPPPAASVTESVHLVKERGVGDRRRTRRVPYLPWTVKRPGSRHPLTLEDTPRPRNGGPKERGVTDGTSDKTLWSRSGR